MAEARKEAEAVEPLVKWSLATAQRLPAYIAAVHNEKDGTQGVRLYETDIVLFNPATKTLTFNSGGYRTRSTLAWTNRYLFGLGLKVAVEKVNPGSKDWQVKAEGKSPVPYKDGLCLKLE